MSDSLIIRDDSGLSAAVRIAEIPEPDLKRLAATACRDRDTDTLLQIMTAYVRLRGRSGAHVSPHTIRSYTAAARALISAWEHQSLMAPTRDAAAIWIRQIEAAG